MKKLLTFVSLTAFVPLVSFAANTNCDAVTGGIGKIICQANQILNSIVPAILSLGVIYFVWGVVQYVIGGGEEAKTKGRDQMIFGIIGLTAIVGVWGLVNIVTNTFGIAGTAAPAVSLITTTGTYCTLLNHPKLQDVLCYATTIINNSIIPLIFALAVVMFVWGVVQFVINSDEEAKKEKGKQFMIWGIIALAVMLSVWGLVGIFTSTFNINGSVLPQVKPNGGNGGDDLNV